ncbi:putative uncharacterized protein [Bacteroides clarus CAG:160]|uniref:leucine-rich repeat domain-containing protein n=1 Tax=Bacteroides clarus TaxID=626929 RepID=UPI00033DBC3C|nr:leucine-rich repeat domain-containing protein [Bacteroides clarus]CDB83286.1 putative uncharacterized protein [Bacteroides clarus CAG:160]
MNKHLSLLEARLTKAAILMMVAVGALSLVSCDDDGLTAGDPNYFTSSRGQFTATTTAGTTFFLIPGTTAGTALVTYDGSNPRHWQSETVATVSVTTYTGTLDIPETIEADGTTYTITGLDEQALMGCRTLTNVILPSTVQTLGEGAFAICTTLASIELPEGITELPVGCFGYCPKLATVTIPSTVKSIGKMAFQGCSALTGLTLPEGLETIGEYAFFECSNSAFTSITIPSTVQRIGEKAFGGRDAASYSKITEYHLKSSIPPTLDGMLYQAADGVSPIIYVPTGSKAAYEAAAGWSSLTIEEE